MDAAVAAVRQYGNQLIELANPELAAYRKANPEFEHPLEGWAFTTAESAFSVVLAYLAFVILGSAFMKGVRKNKAIHALDWFKFWYNPLQSWLSAWLCIEAARQAYFLADAKIIGNSFVPERQDIARVLYWFYISKIFDFVDTVFIVLGCKWRQLSVLHVYHHASIFFTYWVISMAGYDGDIYLTIVLNGAVHAVMYFYYALTSFRLRETVAAGPLFKKDSSGYKPVANSDLDQSDRACVTAAKIYVPKWKKFITYFQQAQFLTMNLHGLSIIFVFQGAAVAGMAYPKRVAIFYVFYIQSLFWLFQNFANKTYRNKKSKKN